MKAELYFTPLPPFSSLLVSSLLFKPWSCKICFYAFGPVLYLSIDDQLAIFDLIYFTLYPFFMIMLFKYMEFCCRCHFPFRRLWSFSLPPNSPLLLIRIINWTYLVNSLYRYILLIQFFFKKKIQNIIRYVFLHFLRSSIFFNICQGFVNFILSLLLSHLIIFRFAKFTLSSCYRSIIS